MIGFCESSDGIQFLASLWLVGVDVGCAQLIMTGKVKVKQGLEVAKYEKNAVVFTDGSQLEADSVIFAYVFTSFILIHQPASRDS